MTDQDDTRGGIFWVRADGGLVSATPGEACDEIKRLRAENARLREALQHAASAMDSLVSDEMPYTQSCMIWRIATGRIREALDLDGQKERRAKALSDLAEMDADLLDIDPEMKP